MKKYLIVLKGESNTGKTTVLKLLSEKLRKEYEFKSYEIDDCEYEEKNLNQIEKTKDWCISFEIDKISKMIISTGGDEDKCINNFLKEFEENDVFIGITACQCVNKNNRYKAILQTIHKNHNFELIELTNYGNFEYRNFLNKVKSEELFELVNNLLVLKKNAVYSMLSDEEKLNLYYLSKHLKLKKNSVIVEYGTFLGGSLQFILNGLTENSTYNNNYIYAIDLFCVDDFNSWFNDFKIRFENLGLENCIEKNKIDWFSYVKDNFKSITNLQLLKSSHENFKLEEKQEIALLHLDLAKRFNTLKDILSNLYVNLNRESLIIHQDFFYHFSGEVIAFLYKMIKEKKIEVELISSFGSIYLKNFTITLEDLNSFDISDIDLMVSLIDESIYFFDKEINFWQKASLYGAIINLLKISGKNYNKYLKKLNQLENKQTANHINRMLDELNNKNLFKGYL